MKAEHLRLEELVRFSEGLVDIHGRRLVLHDLHAMGQFRHDLIDMVGMEQARRIFTRFGYFWGHADAAAMKRIFHWDSPIEWLKAGPAIHTLQGAARVVVKALELNAQEARLGMKVVWHDSGDAQDYLDEIGKANQPVCWIQTGYASGYASYCLGKSVYFIERKCRARGDDCCMGSGKDVDSWGSEIIPHLPYFHADDIKGKIRNLTRELKEKELRLARQQEQLEQVLHGQMLASVEVRSREFIKILDQANRAARFDSSVLITGETGVGKEVLARHMHSGSPRSGGPFVAVNCAALPETLLESELFGHKAGAFTGATRDRPGLFEQARKGIIFLDEIGETTPKTQLKFLRVLQEHEITRVGDTRPRKVDVRVIAATNRDLEKAVSDSAFREDLYYRLNVIRIEVPPLRKRTADILPLARFFVDKCCNRLGLPKYQIDTTCLDILLEYAWPGNIRELENTIEYAVVLASNERILPRNLPSKISRKSPTPEERSSTTRSLAEVEMEHIQRTLVCTGGNREKAARILKIGAATLYRKLKALKASEDSRTP